MSKSWALKHSTFVKLKEFQLALLWLKCEEGGGEIQGRHSIILGNATFSKPN